MEDLKDYWRGIKMVFLVSFGDEKSIERESFLVVCKG
jgi:hypothetical protein